MAPSPLALVIGGIALICVAYAVSQIGQDLVRSGVQEAIRQRRQYYLSG